MGALRAGRLVGALVAVALVTAACGSGGPERAASTTPVTVAQVASTPREPGPSALRDPGSPDLPPPLVPPGEIRSGGPPPDGIPPVDDPRFEPTASVGWLDDDEPVLAFEHAGEARAYPVQILTWHEIVNDTVGGDPVSITYCPLCNSAVAYQRRLGQRVVDFGTSGKLYRSALVMYDRQTESLWTHFDGRAVAGRLTGAVLESLPVATVAWSDFRRAHPRSLVLSRQTGHDRPYGQNPYPGYDDVDSSPFLFSGEVDGRLAAKERVVGVESGGGAVAVPLERLAAERVVPFTLRGRALVALWKAGTASALDDARVAGGRDIGATGVFEPTAGGRTLTLRPAGEGFTDAETGSTWDILGRAVAGPLQGERLPAVPHVDTFWFAWAAYHVRTTLAS